MRLAPHADFLVQASAIDVRHVLFRRFAASTLLTLADQGFLTLDTADRARLEGVNRVRRRVASSSRYTRQPTKLPKSRTKRGHHVIPWDFDRYWVAPLAKTFCLSDQAVINRIERVIRTEWEVKLSNRPRDDPRHVLGIFRNDHTWASHGSHPAVEDRTFYLAYHALLEVAGSLLETRAVHQDNDSGCEFAEWLREYDLTRPDGLWVSDRRLSLERPGQVLDQAFGLVGVVQLPGRRSAALTETCRRFGRRSVMFRPLCT